MLEIRCTPAHKLVPFASGTDSAAESEMRTVSVPARKRAESPRRNLQSWQIFVRSKCRQEGDVTADTFPGPDTFPVLTRIELAGVQGPVLGTSASSSGLLRQEYPRWDSNPHPASAGENLRFPGPIDAKANPINGLPPVKARPSLSLPHGRVRGACSRGP